MIKLENDNNTTINAEIVGEVVKIITVNSITNEKLYTDRIPIPTMKLHQAIMNGLDKEVK